MVSILNRLFFVVMFSLLVSGIYSVGFSGESYAGDNNGTTGGGPAISDDGSSDDGSSDGKSHDDGSSDGNSGGKKKKPKKQWLTDGNADIDSSQNFLGTTDDADLVIKTDNTEKVRVTTDGNIGIGTDSPTGTLHVEGGSADGVAGGKDIILDAQDGGPDGGAGGNILLLPGASGDGSASTGKVLVGTDSSILSLDVNGAIRIRGGAPLVGWVLTALDSDGTAVWQDLNVNDADSDPTNEFQTLVRTDNNVTLSNGGGTVSVADDDSDTANELQSLSVSGTDLTLTNGGGTVSIADNDNDTSNELNTSFSLSGNSLEITDAGGTLSVNLAGLGDDADADPTNELQTLSQVGDDVTLSNGGGTISVADGDNNSANELNTGASLTGTDLKISDAGGDKTVDLSSLVNDADADPVNEIQAMSQVGNSVTLSNGGGTINVADGDSDSGNELNTGASLAGNSLSITDAGGAVTVDLSALADDADADPTNELNTGASLTGTSLKITDGGGDKIVDLSTLVNDADADSTNELNASVVLNGSTLELTDAGGTITADLSSLDNSEVDPEVGPNTTNFMPKWDGSALVTGTIFDDGNKVGIGTINPETSLHIVTDNAFPLIAERVVDNNTGPLVRLRKSRGAINLKSAVNHNDYIGQLSFDGWNGSSYVKGASIIGKVDGIPSSGNIPGRMEFLTNNGSGPSEKMRIDKNGNVGIGTINPGAKLDIFGNIKIEDGTEGADKVLTSDANGVGTWQDAAADDDWTISGNDIYSAVTGNVGVGTIAPATKLDVNGTVTATGLTVPGGSIITDAVTSNTFVGVGTGSSNTTGTSNTAIGAQALRSNTTGTENTAFGQGALQTNTGINNTATGALALLRNTTGNHNTANGYHALVNNTTGSRNVAVGLNALANNTTASNNTATGNSALVFNVTGDSNTANGSWSLMKNVSGSYNSAYGGGALRENTTGDGNTALGYVALNNNTTGQNNTAVGHSALQKNTTGANNVAFGPIALFSNTTGQGNIAIGREALRNNTTGSANHSIGVESMWSNTTGTNNVVNGATALKANTTGNNNVAIGRSALIKNTEGTNNTAIGGTALAFNIIGNHNTAIGNSAGFSSTGSSNVFLGYEAGKNETGDNKLHIANNSTNTLIYGDFASGRVGIGTTAPDSELHVEGNIKMVDGSQAAGLVLTSDANGVGTWQSGSGDNDWTIDGTDMHSTVTGNVGIGTTTPGSKLDVTGTITATGLTVPGGSITTDAIASNTFLGQSAGSSNTTGTQNTAVGNGTLQLNTTGANNNAFG
ncbi:MAG: hypothetical protein HOI47_04065, partial [Candidatus Scalindua sp.]|nr:hypothetical protein [Candidatus Scalindua sp.]MBT6225816.1 hypothetical protein [Candidatus Scalindua sp.]MBT7212607.1 hypothetical protein [Candidatus Scalindua sp.]